MKKQLLTLIAFITTGLAFGQAVNNGGFENWDLTTYDALQYYNNSNFNNSNTQPLNSVKTTDAFHGSFAVQLTTIALGAQTAFGFVANGNPGPNGSGGTPYSQRPTGIRLYYKSTIVGTDSAIVIAQFRKAGSTIGLYLFKIGATKSSYTLFASPFAPALPMAPDTVIFWSCFQQCVCRNRERG